MALKRKRLNETSPSPNGENGRDNSGRFTTGNRYGQGNPSAGKVEQFRHALMDAVTVEDLRAIARQMVKDARHGDRHARTELLNRILGRPSFVNINIEDESLNADDRFL